MDNREDILVRYLDGELTAEEKDELEEQLEANEELQEELDRLRHTREAIRLYGLKQNVKDIHADMIKELRPGQKKIKRISKIARYTIAVAASLLLLVGAYLIYNFATLSSDKIFASRYHPYELVTLRDGSSTESPIEKAYRQKSYKSVVSIHKSGKDLSAHDHFLCGAAALELKDNTTAIDCFRSAILANKSASQADLADEAEYYLALAYIRNKDFDFALGLLRSIRDDQDHLYNKQVTPRLINRVKMLKWR